MVERVMEGQLKGVRNRFERAQKRHREMLIPCEICGRVPGYVGGKVTARDHDHLTGRDRGRLCQDHNLGIGLFRDDPALLRAAADYIERYRR